VVAEAPRTVWEGNHHFPPDSLHRVLALLGLVSAGTAFVWATSLYDNYAWWFRLAGLAVLVGLVWWSLRRRNQCSVAGIRRWRWRLLGVLAIALGTYVALYVLTTWLGTFA
jgi:lipoprotein signal peptidase